MLSIVAERRMLLEVRNLKKYFTLNRGLILRRQLAVNRAVENVSFQINHGETLGLVGESGCGKTTVGRTVLQLESPTAGEVLLDGVDLSRLSPREIISQRRRLQPIFQDSLAALDPRWRIGAILEEPLFIHGLTRQPDWRDWADGLLPLVGLNPAFADRYPHELSGGQRQRIGVARALALKPDLIVCDEPVSALDVSVQAQIVNLLGELQDRLGIAYLFISHDLAVVRHISDHVAVMYLGQIVELAPSREIYENPAHPYTQALLSAVPIPDPKVEANRQQIELRGDLPGPFSPPPGCPFHTRCPAMADSLGCREIAPLLKEVSQGHQASCHRL